MHIKAIVDFEGIYDLTCLHIYTLYYLIRENGLSVVILCIGDILYSSKKAMLNFSETPG